VLTAVTIPLFNPAPALSEITTVCPTRIAILPVPGTNVSFTVIVAVSAAAAAPEAQLVYLDKVRVRRHLCSY
jgi:hypothetical protein